MVPIKAGCASNWEWFTVIMMTWRAAVSYDDDDEIVRSGQLHEQTIIHR